MDAKTLVFSNANTEWLGKYLGAISKNKYIKQNLKTTFVSFACYNNIFLMYHKEVHHDFRFVIQDRTLSFKKLLINAFFVGIRFVH